MAIEQAGLILDPGWWVKRGIWLSASSGISRRLSFGFDQDLDLKVVDSSAFHRRTFIRDCRKPQEIPAVFEVVFPFFLMTRPFAN